MMDYLLQAAVFILMASIGMSLSLRAILDNWRQLSPTAWVYLLLATFVAPVALAIGLADLFHLKRGEWIGLFMVGATPGVPHLIHKMVRQGCDEDIAASYQIWAGLMVPVMIPLVVAAVAHLYNRSVWIPPFDLVVQILETQFLPLAAGLVWAWAAPNLTARIHPQLSKLSNVLMMLVMLVMLFKTGPELKLVSPLVPVAAFLLAAGSIHAISLFRVSGHVIRQTFAICNANQNVGLALLLCGKYLSVTQAVPAVVCYTFIAPLVIFLYPKLFPVPSPASAVPFQRAVVRRT